MVNERETRRDNELAAFTDLLLAEDGRVDNEQRPPLADTVECLARVLTSEEPPDRLRRCIHRVIAEEWEPQARSFQLFGAFRIARRPLWAAAVAVLVVLAVATVLLVTPGTGGVMGTVGGGPWIVPLLILVSLLAAGIVGWILWRR